MDPLVKRYKRGLGGTWGWIVASSGLTTASPGCPCRGHPCHPAPLCLPRVPQENRVPQDPLAKR